jgi:hypothetical protein
MGADGSSAIINPLATSSLAILMLIGGIEGAYGRGSPHEAHTSQDFAADNCGWKNGSLPDPLDTQRCLAERYRAAHRPKAPTSIPPAPAPSNSVVVGPGPAPDAVGQERR